MNTSEIVTADDFESRLSLLYKLKRQARHNELRQRDRERRLMPVRVSSFWWHEVEADYSYRIRKLERGMTE